MLEEALNYLGRASIIPVGKDKKPLIGWKEYQTRKPTEDEVREWFNKWPDANIGIVTGKISNLVVVDVESGGSIEGLPDTQKCKTGNGGWHFYYEYVEGIDNSARIRPLTDIRGEGGFVVAPPSVTQYQKNGKPQGGKYEWLNHVAVQPLPPIFTQKKSNWKEIIVSPIVQGSRNVDFTAIIGGLLSKFPQDDWESMVWHVVQDQNKSQQTPLPLNELRTTFESIASRERQKRSTGGQIKDITSETTDDELSIRIVLDKCVVHFKAKNIISSLLEATVLTWIEKNTGLTDEIPFHVKIKSDSNKEQWVRILGKAFDRKEDKEVYPWTVVVAKVVHVLEVQINNKKQDFSAPEVQIERCNWLLEPFIQENQINTIFGLGSSGKTLLSLYFSKIIARNTTKRTLFIDFEDTKGGWKDKLVRITSDPPINIDLNSFYYFDSEQIPVASQVDKIKEVIKRHDIKFVIVDSASLATGDSTSEESAAVRLISALKLLKVTVLLIAHQRKTDGDKTPIGSIQYENQSRNVWNIKSTPDDVDFRIIHVACTHTKANNTYLRRNPLGFRIEYTDIDIRIEEESAVAYFQSTFTVKERISQLLKVEGPLDSKSIAEKLGISLPSIKKNLTEGKMGGRNMWVNEGNLWFLPPTIPT